MVREIRSIIKEGAIGKILSVEATMPQQTFSLTDKSSQAIKPQSWRLSENGCIPHVSLDLGAHVVNLGEFVTNRLTTSASGFATSRGNFQQVNDYVNATLLLDNEIPFAVMYGKCFLGNDNGLRLTVYGSECSLRWFQKKPDILTLAKPSGEISEVTLMDPRLKEAIKTRYSRFKSGHPTGFIEAFSNYYEDLFHEETNYIFDLDHAIHGLKVLEAIHASSRNHSIFTAVK